MRRSVLAASLVTLGLVLAACGGDDSGATPDQVGQPPREREAAGDESGTGGPVAAPVDPDAVEELLDGLDLDGLDLDGLDLDQLDLDEMFDELDDFITNLGSDGGGVVTVAGVRYQLTSDSCISFGPDFYLDGPAQGSDGSTAWIDASRSTSTRDDLREFMDDAMLDRMFGDADTIDEFFIDVRVGATGRFDFNDDQPNWTATSESGFVFGDGIVEFEFFGNGVRGSGQATDSNGIAAGFGDTVPIEFDLACN